MAPMFLVSNEAMMKAAIDNGVMGVFPALNFRKKGELQTIIRNLHTYKSSDNGTGSFGVNLIVQKSNPLYHSQLEICLSEKVPFFISSLGNPSEVIKGAHSYGAKVYCDVTNLAHAEKSSSKGCDGFIAVGQGAGGHAGPNPLTVLVPALRKNFPHIPVIAAGGIVNGASVLSMLILGAEGVSVGTRFIASREADVSEAYKLAVINAGMDEIVLTEKLSGTPCTIIDTPYAKKIGYRQNAFERFLSRSPRTKKYFKMMVQLQGLKKLERAVKPGNYENLWCAGKSVELIDEISTCGEIIRKMEEEMKVAYLESRKLVSM